MEKIAALARNILIAAQQQFMDPSFDRSRYLLRRYPELELIDLPASIEELEGSWALEARHVPSSHYIAEGLLRRATVALEAMAV